MPMWLCKYAKDVKVHTLALQVMVNQLYFFKFTLILALGLYWYILKRTRTVLMEWWKPVNSFTNKRQTKFKIQKPIYQYMCYRTLELPLFTAYIQSISIKRTVLFTTVCNGVKEHGVFYDNSPRIVDIQSPTAVKTS